MIDKVQEKQTACKQYIVCGGVAGASSLAYISQPVHAQEATIASTTTQITSVTTALAGVAGAVIVASGAVFLYRLAVKFINRVAVKG